MFNVYCRSNWKKYCDKYGYDLIVINEHLDNSQRSKERSPAWQKLLILSQEWSSSYDQIVWIDTDVFINPKNSSCIASLVPPEKVGAVEAYSIPSKEIYHTALRRQYEDWRKSGVNYFDNSTPGLFYEKRGIPGADLDKVVQTGVYVCSPRHHRDIFEHIYNTYEDIHKSAAWNYEMPAMSYELVKNDVVHWIPAQYNFCVGDIVASFYPFIFENQKSSLPRRAYLKVMRKLGVNKECTSMLEMCLRNIYDIGCFIHFAGRSKWMSSLYSKL
ncbi:hypothetical protein OAZ06_03155 [Synechococcus sp. AH-736-G20]|nr:hypothetical protein [Synechococcus sp. AH-736-G20]